MIKRFILSHADTIRSSKILMFIVTRILVTWACIHIFILGMYSPTEMLDKLDSEF